MENIKLDEIVSAIVAITNEQWVLEDNFYRTTLNEVSIEIAPFLPANQGWVKTGAPKAFKLNNDIYRSVNIIPLCDRLEQYFYEKEYEKLNKIHEIIVATI